MLKPKGPGDTALILQSLLLFPREPSGENEAENVSILNLLYSKPVLQQGFCAGLKYAAPKHSEATLIFLCEAI